MPKNTNSHNASPSLRQRAEASLLELEQNKHLKKARPAMDKTDDMRLLHELEVHQVELQMQNAELQAARDQAESMLEKYTTLYDFAPVGYFTLTPSSAIKMVNLTGAKLTGITRSHLAGKSFAHLISLAQRPVFIAFLNKVFSSPDQQSGDFTLAEKNLNERAVNISAQSSPDSKECHAVITDITARKQAAQALETSETDYRTLFDLVPVAVYSCDATGKLKKFNSHAASIWGHDSTIGSPGKLFCSPIKLFRTDGSRISNSECPMANVLSGKRKIVHNEEVVIGRADGSQISVILNIRPLLDQRGKISGAINCAYDITVRKQVEQTKQRLAVMTASNTKLKQEIVRRQITEKALKKSEQNQSRLLAQSEAMQQQLRQLSHQILHAQEEERRRVSRELHDVISQTLASINIRLSALKESTASDTKELHLNIARTQQSVLQSVEIVHRFARELRPTVLDDLGLIPALHAFMTNFKKETGIHVRLSPLVNMEKLSPDALTVLYRVTQEALLNVARHSHASRVEVSLKKTGDFICLKIKDNGKGFSPRKLLHSKSRQRLGLLGMKERLEMLAGKFSLESSPGKGTTILAEIPRNQNRGKNKTQTAPYHVI